MAEYKTVFDVLEDVILNINNYESEGLNQLVNEISNIPIGLEKNRELNPDEKEILVHLVEVVSDTVEDLNLAYDEMEELKIKVNDLEERAVEWRNEEQDRLEYE